MNADLRIQEFTNVLSFNEIDKIYLTLISDVFPWYWSGSMTVNKDWYNLEKDNNTKEYLQLVHQFNKLDGTSNSEWSDMTDHILKRFLDTTGIKIKKLFKVKANLQPKVESFESRFYNCPHTDGPHKHYVLLYYPHLVEGNTRIFSRLDGESKSEYKIIKEIIPEAGKFVLFDGRHYHTGAHPNLSDIRLVINFNFEIDE